MDELLKLITNYGFPIVISVYLLVRLEKRIADLEKAITTLAARIDTLVDIKER